MIGSAFLCLSGLHAPIYAGGKQTVRIGYLEAGPYWVYAETLKAIQASLDASEWGNRIEFPADAHLSPGWEKPPSVCRAAAAALMARRDLDLLIVMGTQAAVDALAVNNHRTPLLAAALSDPVASGVVASETDSGVDNLTSYIIPDRWKIMLNLFHEVVGFKKLGVVYHDSEAGRAYANVQEARQAAQALGFTLLERKTLSSAETVEETLDALRSLKQDGMDAFYIPSIMGFDWSVSDTQRLYGYLLAEHVATFARDGSPQVSSGALLGLSTHDFGPVGNFLASNIIRVLQGASPRSLPMVHRVEPRLAVNLETARRIGFHFPVDVLVTADEIYDAIVPPADRKYP